MNCQPASFTAYPETEAYFTDLLEKCEVDFIGLIQALRRCGLVVCHGMCCYDGVYLHDDEAALIPELAELNHDIFLKIGVPLPDKPVIEGEWRGKLMGPKTAVMYHPFLNKLPNYPKHFQNTSCVFR